MSLQWSRRCPSFDCTPPPPPSSTGTSRPRPSSRKGSRRSCRPEGSSSANRRSVQSARLPSGSGSVHQAVLVPCDEARHLPKAFNGLAGSVRLTTGYGSADDSAEEPLPFIPGTRKDFDPGVDEELHRD